MHIHQDVKLSRGAEFCRLTVGSTRSQTMHIVVSHAKRGNDSSCGPKLGWEASVQIDLPSPYTCCNSIVESLIAMKLREGFHITNNNCYLPQQTQEQFYLQNEYLVHGNGLPVEAQPCYNPSLVNLPLKIDNPGAEQDYSRQKERKGGTSIYQLAQYFHLPINDAAKLLDICPTVLKKICRRHGLRRWPHRKLKSINKSIEKMEVLWQSLQKEPGKEHQLTLIATKLSDLKQERAVLCFETECNATIDI